MDRRNPKTKPDARPKPGVRRLGIYGPAGIGLSLANTEVLSLDQSLDSLVDGRILSVWNARVHLQFPQSVLLQNDDGANLAPGPNEDSSGSVPEPLQ